MSLVEQLWYGERPETTIARAALMPASILFGLVQSTRSALYARGLLASSNPALPVIAVGNLSIGGTGKTPVAAWIASRLDGRARPAIVMRGYRGGDESDVHMRLNPNVPVFTNPDRLQGVRDAASAGADVAVLDDAFQHRRIRRTADVVLVSAEQLARPVRLLPAGPWREPLSSARRADHVIITRKSATDGDVEHAMELLRNEAGRIPISIVRLSPSELKTLDGASQPLDSLRGAAVLAIAAIGEPGVFSSQLEQLGARVTLVAFRDHHIFSREEVRSLAARVPVNGLAVCTLKDAVKLANLWPGPSRLWYVSQQLKVQHGADDLDRLLQRVLDARTAQHTTAG